MNDCLDIAGGLADKIPGVSRVGGKVVPNPYLLVPSYSLTKVATQVVEQQYVKAASSSYLSIVDTPFQRIIPSAVPIGGAVPDDEVDDLDDDPYLPRLSSISPRFSDLSSTGSGSGGGSIGNMVSQVAELAHLREQNAELLGGLDLEDVDDQLEGEAQVARLLQRGAPSPPPAPTPFDSLSAWADNFIDRRADALEIAAAGGTPSIAITRDLTSERIDKLNHKLLAQEGPNSSAASKLRQLERLNRMDWHYRSGRLRRTILAYYLHHTRDLLASMVRFLSHPTDPGPEVRLPTRLGKVPPWYKFLADRGLFKHSVLYPNLNGVLCPHFIQGRSQFRSGEVEAYIPLCRLRYTSEMPPALHEDVIVDSYRVAIPGLGTVILHQVADILSHDVARGAIRTYEEAVSKVLPSSRERGGTNRAVTSMVEWHRPAPISPAVESAGPVVLSTGQRALIGASVNENFFCGDFRPPPCSRSASLRWSVCFSPRSGRAPPARKPATAERSTGQSL
ncbi:hypothetical protein B484DRAFT_462108 [Ochromonadaceae sp. CCMP2298]|nr:hypothetical protein B484DRAFT_462108 [Ochromonadaceae sp. CCMP2298]